MAPFIIVPPNAEVTVNITVVIGQDGSSTDPGTTHARPSLLPLLVEIVIVIVAIFVCILLFRDMAHKKLSRQLISLILPRILLGPMPEVQRAQNRFAEVIQRDEISVPAKALILPRRGYAVLSNRLSPDMINGHLLTEMQ